MISLYMDCCFMIRLLVRMEVAKNAIWSLPNGIGKMYESIFLVYVSLQTSKQTLGSTLLKSKQCFNGLHLSWFLGVVFSWPLFRGGLHPWLRSWILVQQKISRCSVTCHPHFKRFCVVVCEWFRPTNCTVVSCFSFFFDVDVTRIFSSTTFFWSGCFHSTFQN